MNAVDTNVFIYSIDRRDLAKRAKARDLLRHLRSTPPTTVLLWQVAGEFLNQLRTWQHQGELTPSDVRRYLGFFRRFFPLTLPTVGVMDRALELADRFSLSHWDSMLVGACIEAGIDTLYTEDMGAPMHLDGVQLVNPFI
jgi:predicted nucleic acid-binding protein